MNDNTKTDQLDWLAFCYVADEMSSDDRADFELRLADDQSARDAIVRAMHLGESVSQAISESMIPAVASQNDEAIVEMREQANPRFPHVQLVLAATILLALFSAGWVWMSDSEETDHVQVAEVWAQVSHENPEDALVRKHDVEVSLVEELAFVDELDEETDLAEETELEDGHSDDSDDWMMIALVNIYSDSEKVN